LPRLRNTNHQPHERQPPSTTLRLHRTRKNQLPITSLPLHPHTKHIQQYRDFTNVCDCQTLHSIKYTHSLQTTSCIHFSRDSCCNERCSRLFGYI
ncbi:hypothetical protein, partial [Methanobacterium sp.]|uniref:hypothetical protein n=1 Tax=Methanobacterium sp. TaxID=2164 RepID=UPI0025D614BA